LNLALRSRAGNAVQMVPELFEARVVAVCSIAGQAPESVSWVVKGSIAPTLRWNPRAGQIGVQSGRAERIEKTVDIEAAENISRIDAALDPFWTVTVFRPQGQSSGNTFRAVVHSNGKLVPRQVADVIRLTPVSREGERLPVKELRIVGDIVPDVGAIPQEIHHGRQFCGTEGVEAIRLRSLTGRPFRVKSTRADTPDLQVSRLPTGSEEWTYALRLQFARKGNQRAIAEFFVEEADGTACRVTVPVRYEGLHEPDSMR
jgi:hypothetical protein